MTKTLFFAGQPGEGYGWGVCCKYLIQELGKLCQVITPPRNGVTVNGPTVFMPIADHELNPAAQSPIGSKVLGLCFFEFPLGPKAQENAKLYDLIFCGSSWCKERLAERGIHNTEVLIQGVDHEIFFSDAELVKAGGGVSVATSKQRAGEFWLFSGGKFEYRKGQDIVLAAFKMLQEKYHNMKLLVSWENLWPKLCLSMKESPHLKFEWFHDDGFNENIWNICAINGIDPHRVGLIPACTGQRELADWMRSTDLGVFPNRCEGGTNLVLMEYLACGKPAIATKWTGHRDIYERNFVPIPEGQITDMKWFETDPRCLADMIEWFYNLPDRSDPIALGFAPESMSKYTWERAARQILEHV